MTWDPAAIAVSVVIGAVVGWGLGRYVRPASVIWWTCGIGVLVGVILVLTGEDLGAQSLLIGGPAGALMASITIRSGTREGDKV